MPTKFEKARLLLIEGAVGLSSSELSSFHAMKEVNKKLPCEIKKREFILVFDHVFFIN